MEMVLNGSAELYRKGRCEANALLCEEQAKLLRHQRSLQEKLNMGNLLGLSVTDTLKKLLLMKEFKLADKLRQEYKIPDRRCRFDFVPFLIEKLILAFADFGGSKSPRWLSSRNGVNWRSSPKPKSHLLATR